MKKKLVFNVDQIIQANLMMPSIQRTLKEEFKIFNISYNVITNEKFIKFYKNWPEERKEYFHKIIGGNVYRHKVKDFLNKISKNEVKI